MNLYLWYRVERDSAEAETAVRSMMARVACRTGVAGRLLKKHDEPHVWMEIYENVGEISQFQRVLAEKADEFDVGMFIDGSRHVECFEETAVMTPTCATPAQP